MLHVPENATKLTFVTCNGFVRPGSQKVPSSTISLGKEDFLAGQVTFNPISPKSDRYQISPCIDALYVKQSEDENYGHDHTR